MRHAVYLLVGAALAALLISPANRAALPAAPGVPPLSNDDDLARANRKIARLTRRLEAASERERERIERDLASARAARDAVSGESASGESVAPASNSTESSREE